MTDRARVPFALVGALLLVTSATYVAGVDRPDPAADPATERAVEAATAALHTELRAAARGAGRRAAAAPVALAANTTAGRVLNASDPFRDALRVRLALAARERLGAVEARAGPVTATVRLPAVETGADLRRAKRAVTVARAGPNGTALRVTLRNVTVVVSRRGRVVERVALSPTLVVHTPVLYVHDRVRAFERRLRAAPAAPGLTRRLTARLHAVTWARGYAQFGGAGITNVLATRHVAHATNGALLSQQRAAFGRADGAARDAYTAMTTRVAATDTLVGVGASGDVAATLRASTDRAVGRNDTWEPTAWGGDHPGRGREVRVDAGGAATGALVDATTGEDAAVPAAVDAVYGATVRVRAGVRLLDADRAGPADLPNWTLVDERVRTRRSVSPRPASRPPGGAGWHALETYGRTVVERRVVTRRWRRDGRTRTTESVSRRRYAVTLTVVGDHAPSEHAPPRPVERVHRPGGPLGGSNLAGVERRAVDRLVTDRGGPGALARRAVAGTLDATPVTVSVTPPPGIDAWVERDLLALRDRVANVSVRAERGSLATLTASPHARLADAIRRRRAALVAAPDAYRNVATKARVAARAAYLDRVIAVLETRAARRGDVRRRVDDRLDRHGLSLDTLGVAGDASGGVSTARGPSPVRLSVDAAPPYLPTQAVDGDAIDARVAGRYYGLRTRNVNLFTTPYAAPVDGLAGGLFAPGRVPLRRAAGSLRAANAALDTAARNATTLADRRERLRRTVRAALRRARRVARTELRRAGVGHSARERRRIVAHVFARRDGPAVRALAVANGSVARQTAALAGRRGGLGPLARERLRYRLHERLGGVTVPAGPTNRTARVLRTAATDLATAGAKRGLRRAVGRIPAGLPVLPAPPHWYATTNVWVVQVRGTYARFTVRAPVGPPGRSLAYTRDGRAVRLDWDDDGTAERLGRASRVSFRVRTAVAIAVPPRPRGVGDKGGVADERSPGWPG